MNRKGFPESYDTRRLLTFLRELKSGEAEVRAPIYSHVVYDIIADQKMTVRQPDILILEGLNVLQAGAAQEFVSDYFDYSIYIDAERVQHRGLVRRTVPEAARDRLPGPRLVLPALRRPVRRPGGQRGPGIWHGINGKNLKENILPTRARAALILHKADDHRVTSVQLRKL